VDIRQSQAVADALRDAQPELVLHLAAQSLVRPSYEDPLRTWSTNVMGTAHVLEACRHVASVRAIVVVTSDKCYENQESDRGYRETDRLGGHDPYSASKAGAELVAASYRQAFFSGAGRPLLATARAGNVIGGGDWSRDRLVPDLVRAVAAGTSLQVRSPKATRPWQHVLESLSGYLLLGQHLLEGDDAAATAWNFGPDESGMRTVESVLVGLKEHWPELRWTAAAGGQPHETTQLKLDSSKARAELDWRPVWDIDQALAATAQWYRAFLQSAQVRSANDLDAFSRAAAAAGAGWAA
jgi:CDP-glucose 4,6-dehydratase